MDSKNHFLKPYVTSINGHPPIAELPRGRERFSLSSSDVNVISKKIDNTGFRVARSNYTSWAKKMETLHEATWRQAGIYEAIRASTYNIPKDPSLIIAIAEYWCPETNTFVFPWGEATITLEDVTVLLGFSLLGSCVNVPLETSEMRDTVAKLKQGREAIRCRTDQRVAHEAWVSSFKRDDADVGEIEHEAFLTAWLSDFVFPELWKRSISSKVLPLAIRLARGEKIALAPAVLASVYRDITTIHGFGRRESRDRIELKSVLKLVLLWIWERFPNISPVPREIGMGESRVARWSLELKESEKNGERLISFGNFQWRPYAKPLMNWSQPKYYVDEAKWVNIDDSVDDDFLTFARCLRGGGLVGIRFVEDYYPNRVVMQFGFDQELPGLVTHRRNITEKEAWDEYNKSLDGLKLYVPSRLATTSVTDRYKDWWSKSFSEFISYEESFNARNTGGVNIAEMVYEFTTKMKISRKQTDGDASERLGKRSRHEEDKTINDAEIKEEKNLVHKNGENGDFSGYGMVVEPQKTRRGRSIKHRPKMCVSSRDAVDYVKRGRGGQGNGKSEKRA